MEQNTQIGLFYPDKFSQDVVDELLADIKDTGVNIQVVPQEPQMYASAEWAIPGMIVAYILKPYFEAFLGEAGKSHYEILSKWLKKVLGIGRSLIVKRFSATASPDKQVDGKQSASISVYFQTKNNIRIKLLFDESLSLDEWQKAMDKMLDIMLKHYQGDGDNVLTLALTEQNVIRGIIYALINTDTKEWMFISERSLSLMLYQNITQQQQY